MQADNAAPRVEADSSAPVASCLATSYGMCEVQQSVDLVAALRRVGCPSALATLLLDSGVPLALELEFGASEVDEGRGQLILMLDDGTEVGSRARSFQGE